MIEYIWLYGNIAIGIILGGIVLFACCIAYLKFKEECKSEEEDIK